jgi:hypothetical protein
MGELPHMRWRVNGRLVDVRYASEAPCCFRVADAATTTCRRVLGAKRVPRCSKPHSPVFRDDGPVPACGDSSLRTMLVCVDTLGLAFCMQLSASPMSTP